MSNENAASGDTTIYMNNTLDLTFPVTVPKTASAFDRMAGRTGACVEEAVRNVIYRGVNHDFRAALCERLEAETGEPRKSHEEGEGEKKRTVYDETEKQYKARLIVEGHTDDEQCQLFANEIGKTIVFDPSPSSRSKKAPKEIENAADNLLAAIEGDSTGSTTAETVAGKIASRLGIAAFADSFGEWSRDSLIAALVALKEKEDRERTNSLL